MAAPPRVDVVYEIALVSGAGTTPASPASLWMEAPYPQPAHGAVSIAFGIGRSGRVLLAVYDALGRRVATIADGERGAGRHLVTGHLGGMPPGVYLLVLSAGGESVARRVALR
jgi:hypothetical protein